MLEIRDLTIRYGQHLALDRVSLQLAAPETVVVLGANGAGKSSLLRAIGGLVRPAPGSEILLGGRTLLSLPTHLLPEAGVVLVPEGRGLFGTLSVEENLRLGANPRRARAIEADRMDLVLDLFPKLKERRRQIASTMSGGEQQMVAIGRALMSNPDYLLLDEPSLGLAPVIVGDLFKALARIKGMGVGLMLVEQNVRASLKIADRGYLVEAGRITGTGTANELLDDPAVQQTFLGGNAA